MQHTVIFTLCQRIISIENGYKSVENNKIIQKECIQCEVQRGNLRSDRNKLECTHILCSKQAKRQIKAQWFKVNASKRQQNISRTIYASRNRVIKKADLGWRRRKKTNPLISHFILEIAKFISMFHCQPFPIPIVLAFPRIDWFNFVMFFFHSFSLVSFRFFFHCSAEEFNLTYIWWVGEPEEVDEKVARKNHESQLLINRRWFFFGT